MFAFYGDLDKISMDKTGHCYCGNTRGKWVNDFYFAFCTWLHKIGQCLMGCGHIGGCWASQAGATFGRWEMVLPGGQEGWNGCRTNLRYLHFALHELNVLVSLYAFSIAVHINDIFLTITEAEPFTIVFVTIGMLLEYFE